MKKFKNSNGVETLIFADTFEYEAYEQVKKMAEFEVYKNSKIRIMPDAHAGKGCTVGTTMVISDKITPNLVGVDIGCTDLETEYLTKNGWKKIGEYSGEQILVYDLKNDKSRFESPINYIKIKNDVFYHLKTKYGINQMLSKDHTCLIETGSHHRENSRNIKYTINAKELYLKHSSLKLGFRDNFICEIPNLQLNESNKLTDEEIRVQVMVMADGHVTKYGKCICQFIKKRKIDRCINLLNAANIKYEIKKRKKIGLFAVQFIPPVINKRISYFFNSNLKQLSIICSEVMLWDGCIKDNVFVSNYKEDVDFVQYAFATQGYRTSINNDFRKNKITYRCIVSEARPRVQLGGSPKTDINIVKSVDGYKYCFTTSTGFWIMRRGGCIAITGNCGMLTIKLKNKGLNFNKLDSIINEKVPHGHEVHIESKTDFDFSDLRCKKHVNPGRALLSIGSLGGGNHFIELGKSTYSEYLYLVIHSGSRKLGVEVCKYYQDLAFKNSNEMGKIKDALIKRLKSEGRMKDIDSEIKKLQKPITNKELAFLTGQDFEDYMNDMSITQRFASVNRETIAKIIMKEMGFKEESRFDTIHNYIDFKRMILRKGAVSAEKGELLLIPINMRDGSLLCVGKGNEDWNYSAPHGAGRLMSRTKAKQLINMDEFKETMKGIHSSSVVIETLDEAPQAYKSIDEIKSTIVDTVDIIDVIKPLYNFKSHE